MTGNVLGWKKVYKMEPLHLIDLMPLTNAKNEKLVFMVL